MKDIIANAVKQGQKALSEYDSKRVIERAGVTITREALVQTKEQVLQAVRDVWVSL